MLLGAPPALVRVYLGGGDPFLWLWIPVVLCLLFRRRACQVHASEEFRGSSLSFYLDFIAFCHRCTLGMSIAYVALALAENEATVVN